MAATEAVVGHERAERQPRSITIRVSTLIFLTILVLAAGFWAFIAQYEPLAAGSMAGVDATGARTIDTFPGDELILLDHRRGEEFFASFTIRNEGPLPITIERFLDGWQLQERSGGPFSPVEVVVHPGERFIGAESIPFEEWPSFSPFSLGAGQERRVAIRFSFGDCRLGKGETFGMNSISARFAVLGFDRHTDYPLPYNLAMRSARSGGCP